MKTTVFTKYHIAAGAKMAEFAGYNMPIEFTGINDEHMAVRNGAGVFDVSHMGEIWVKGPRALDLLQRITTNDVSKLFDGKVQYTCMPNGRGGIVDDILVYRVDAETYMLCVNAANIDKDWKHICAEGKAFGMEAGHGRELYNASDEICQLAVQGPLAMKIVQKMCAEPVEGMEYYTFKKMPVAGCDAILLDVKTGSGALMPTLEESVQLGREMVRIGKAAGRRVMAMVTDMDQPLGHNIGNALEIIEAAEILKGRDSGRACRLCLEVAARMVMLSFDTAHDTAYAQVQDALKSGSGLKKLRQMLAAQGGNANVLDDYSLLPQANEKLDVFAEKDGFISFLEAQKLGLASKALGAGRSTKDAPVDYAVGIVLHKQVGDAVSVGEVLATLYINDRAELGQAMEMLRSAIVVSDKKPAERPLIYETIE